MKGDDMVLSGSVLSGLCQGSAEHKLNVPRGLGGTSCWPCLGCPGSANVPGN